MISFSPNFPLTQSNTPHTRSKGEDLERNDGSSERPYYMSPELHEILSKAKRLEEDQDGVDLQVDSAKQADEVKLEEETPLHQQEDGEIQLKHQTMLKQDNEEEQPLQTKTEEPKEEKSEEQKDGEAEEAENKEEPEVKEEEKQELKQEEKMEEEAPPPAVEAEKEETDEKKEEKDESKEENPPVAPQE